MNLRQFTRSPRGTLLMVLGFAALIVALSSIPAHSMPKAAVIWRWDKLIHACEYGVAATLVFRALWYLSRIELADRSLLWTAIVALVICSFFGISDELYQGTVVGRDSSGFDVLADIVGAGFATLANALYYSYQRSQSDNHSKVCQQGT